MLLSHEVSGGIWTLKNWRLYRILKVGCPIFDPFNLPFSTSFIASRAEDRRDSRESERPILEVRSAYISWQIGL